jgi:cytochrome c-type biogenesis protein
LLGQFTTSFLLGLATPLTAVCVLPLYPGFISYLSNQMDGSESQKTYALFGGLVVAGIISFMLVLGLLFTTIIGTSLTVVTEVVSPIAFTVLGVISLFLIFDVDFQSFFPSYQAPRFEDPLKNAFSFGFFFGGIVLPCNPGYIAVFLAEATLFSSPVSSLGNFLLFGFGMGAPLFAFTLVSAKKSEKIIGFLKSHEKSVNQGSGLLMLTISLYYLFFVFKVITLSI